VKVELPRITVKSDYYFYALHNKSRKPQTEKTKTGLFGFKGLKNKQT